jgi:hypothetical protein
MVSEESRSQKMMQIKRQLSLQRLSRIAQCGSRNGNWNEATGNTAFYRSICKDPDGRDDLDIENIVLGLKLCKALQVCTNSG